jgi:UPF0271 protein
MVDLNCDLGEGFGVWQLTDDDALLDIVTSANVACGFHAGDPSTMRRVCDRAADRGVAVGAQVSYRDLAGFGRRYIAATYQQVRDDVLYQIGALAACCRPSSTRVRYVKPHGALYHACSTDPEHARAVIDAMRSYDDALVLLAAAGSAFLVQAQQAGVTTVAEGFADRAYRGDGTLVPRGEGGAVITDPATAAQQARAIAERHEVSTVDGSVVVVDARSICVHGDTPHAVPIARAVRAGLEAAGNALAPFA